MTWSCDLGTSPKHRYVDPARVDIAPHRIAASFPAACPVTQQAA